MKHLSQLGILLAAACVSLAATPAQALNQISWVSSNGGGAACTRSAPCADFNQAIAGTNPGGYVHCVDAGFYGTMEVNKSITIDCRGTTATSTALNINSAGLTITVRGIAFEQVTAFSAIVAASHSTLVIEDCAVSAYSASGSPFAGNAVLVRPNGAGTTRITINNFVGAALGNNGMFIDSTGSSSPIQVSVSNSVFASNAGSGVVTNASASAEIRLMLDGVKISGNGIGINSNGPLSNVIIGRSTVTENQVGFATAGGGRIFSYGTNQINGNNNDNVNVSTLISQN